MTDEMKFASVVEVASRAIGTLEGIADAFLAIGRGSTASEVRATAQRLRDRLTEVLDESGGEG